MEAWKMIANSSYNITKLLVVLCNPLQRNVGKNSVWSLVHAQVRKQLHGKLY